MLRTNEAYTVLSPFIVTVVTESVPVPSPLQPVNTQPSLACAVKVTTVPSRYWAWSGDRSTVPLPPWTTLNADMFENVAVTAMEDTILNPSGLLELVTSPLQPTKW